jgi:hypothetical protein
MMNMNGLTCSFDPINSFKGIHLSSFPLVNRIDFNFESTTIAFLNMHLNEKSQFPIHFDFIVMSE